MINCTYDRENCRMSIFGHAGYAPKGADIVCAGVTALEIALEHHFYTRDGCYVRIEPSSAIFVGTEETRDVMDCIWGGLTAIGENYENWVVCARGGVDNPLQI